MPPTRSARGKRFSTSSSICNETPAVVPNFESAEERIKWVYQLRHISRSTHVKFVSAKAPKKAHRCSLCERTFNGDPKTIDRHELTDEHLLQVAKVHHIDFDSLRAPRIPCAFCGKGIAGKRNDSHKRHESNCKENPDRVTSGLEDDESDESPKGLRRTRSLTQAAQERKCTSKPRPLGRSTSMPNPSSFCVAPPEQKQPDHTNASEASSSCASPQSSLISQFPPHPPQDGVFDQYFLWPPVPAPSDFNISTLVGMPVVHPVGGDVMTSLRLPISVAVGESTEYELFPQSSLYYDPIFQLPSDSDFFAFDSYFHSLHSPEEPTFEWLLKQEFSSRS